MNRLRLCIASALAALCLAGCGHKPYEISQSDRDRFSAGMIDVPLSGKPPLIEGLSDCIVWKAQYTGDRIAGWKAALGADWGGSYPKFMTACVDESIAYRNKRVEVYLCARALGAGGGCNNGGHYWSYSGERPWRVGGDNGRWYDLPQ